MSSANVTEKLWGWSERLSSNTFRNTVKRGGYCSIHRHRGKRQIIVCERGQLIIEEFSEPDSDPIFRTTLHSGHTKLTLPYQWHRFISPDGAIFSETYLPVYDWAPEPSDEDIDRFDTGGVTEERQLCSRKSQ